ncbi:MAG: biotin--[Eubacterium sp.]|nr:biotin--[acetyl-CoA-carboxylase] ligase [Eubacterium sp.]
MKEKIRTILMERGGFVSGQELSKLLGVSRTAVWKAIRQLEEAGYEIEAVRNKGYRLVSEPDLLTAEVISARLSTKWAGQEILSFDEIDSTNNEVKRRAEAGAGHGLLAVSEVQTAGRGRMGRPWSSPAGSGIWMSLLLRPALAPIQASGLTLVMALAVREAIVTMTGAACGIKWPNDIVSEGRKVCGILTEMSAEPDRINHIVIGVGINVTDDSFPEEICDRAISIWQICGQKIRRAELIAEILKQFELFFDRYLQNGDMSALLEDYNAALINRGQKIRVLDPAGEYEAVADGINASGALIVEKDGMRKEIISGEVSVRGVYGYV